MASPAVWQFSRKGHRFTLRLGGKVKFKHKRRHRTMETLPAGVRSRPPLESLVVSTVAFFFLFLKYSHADYTTLMAENEEELKSLLSIKEESEKAS